MGPGLWEFKSGAGAGSSRAPGILGRRGDALPARGCLSSHAGCCSSGMERAAAPWPRLCRRGSAGGWLDTRAAAACCRLLQRPPATGVAVVGADGAASTPAASCSCTQPLLTPTFLELTPSPALFPGQKGLEHLQAALQCTSGRGCAWGQGAGCCLLSTQGTGCP